MNMLNYSDIFFNPIEEFEFTVVLHYGSLYKETEKMLIGFVYEPTTQEWVMEGRYIPSQINKFFLQQKEKLAIKLMNKYQHFFSHVSAMMNEVHQLSLQGILGVEVKSIKKVNKSKYSDVEYVMNTKNQSKDFTVQFCLKENGSINHVNFIYQKTNVDIVKDIYGKKPLIMVFGEVERKKNMIHIVHFYNKRLKKLVAS